MNYIALLRGINVSGKNKIPMAALKQNLEQCGFRDIWTYIQSGNVAFNTEKPVPEKELVSLLENYIKKDFGFDVPVIIRHCTEITEIMKADPFPDLQQTDEEKMHVTLLSEIPDPELIRKIEEKKYLPDRFVVLNREIYLFCPAGYGQTRLTNTFFESKLKVRATTRNRRTMKVIAGYCTNCLA